MCYKKITKLLPVVLFPYHQHILVFRVSHIAQDKCIKNEGALTVRTIERITG